MLANNLAEYDEKNPAHASLGRFALTQEADMMKRPVDKRQDDQGRMFASKFDYDRMNRAQREKHWTFSPDDLSYMAVRSIARRAKADLATEDEKFTRRARARGLIAEEQRTEAAPTATVRPRRLLNEDDDDDSASNEVSKPQSPTISSSPKLAASKGANSSDPKSGLEHFAKRFLG
jgi:hypothetical protein